MKLFILACLLFLSAHSFGEVSSVSSTFVPAQALRSHMDIGGVWSGTSDVSSTTGDTFTIEIPNTGATAYDVSPSVNLPANFNLVGTGSVSQSGAGCAAAPSVSASQTGSVVSFNLSGYDQPADCSLSISYGLTTSASAAAGTFSIQSSVTFSETDGGAQGAAVTDDLSVIVRAGLSAIAKTPSQQSRAVGDVAVFTVSVCNTGAGGLFDVVVDESFISPTNPSGSLSLASMTQTAPASPVASGAAPVLTLPYLAPSECFDVAVNADVVSCQDISNEASTNDRTGATSGSVSANVKLNLTTPLISYSAPAINVPATGSATVSFDVTNTGLGVANNVVLSFQGLPSDVLVSNVTGPWTWDSIAQTFTATGPISNGPPVNLSFDVEKVGTCPPVEQSSDSYLLAAAYQDGCGNSYAVPVNLGAYTIAGSNDPFTLSKTVSDNGGSSTVARINVGEAGKWTLNFNPGSAADVAQLVTDPLVITDILSAGPTGYSLGAIPAGTTATCSSGCVAGSTVTWTIPKAAMSSGPLNLEVNFTAPTDPCSAGGSIANTAAASYTYTAGACSDSQNATASFYVTNTVGSTGSSTQSYNVSNASGGSATYFETGLNDDGDLLEEHNLGEGDHIYFTNTISFPSGFVGVWAGSKYSDNAGGLSGVSLVSGSLTVTSSDFVGASTQAIPGGSVSFGPGGLSVDLGFLQGASFFNDNNVQGKTLEVKYAVTVNHSAVLPGVEVDVISQGVFEIANTASGSGCGVTSNETFSQAVGFSLFRRQSLASISIPASIQICEPFTATVRSIKNSARPFGWDPSLTLSEVPYQYVHPQVPTYSGFFTSGNMTYNDNGGVNPVWSATTSPLEQTSAGNISFQAVLPAGSSLSPAPFSVTLSYDDSQELTNAGLFFSDVSNRSPKLVRAGDLTITTTPSLVTVLGEQVVFSIYITNGGAGTAFNASVTDVLPTAFTPNEVDTNTANGGSLPVVVSGQSMTWTLGDMVPGETKEVVVVADVNGGSCSLPPGSNSIQARWGCGSPFVNHEVESSNLPNFNFPSAQIQVSHDTSNTQVAMCDSDSLGKDIITFKNAGVTTIKNAYLTEVLNPATTGIDIAAGSVEFSLNGGAWTATVGPAGSGTSASPYRWDQTLIPAMASLSPGDEISIRFPISANETVNAVTPSVIVNGGGELTCGTAVSAPAPSSYNLKVLKPNISLAKVGRNLTMGGAFSETVYGKPTDQIEWRITVNNSGDYTAKTLELTEDYPNTGGASASLTGPGHTATSFPDGSMQTIPDIASAGSSTYTLTQTLGSTCVNEVNTASLQWGCTAPASLSTPSDNSDTANLVMNPTFSSSGGSIVQNFTSLENGRMSIQVVATNGGSFAQNISLTDTLPAGFVIDSSFTPTVASSGSVTAVSVAGTASVPIFNFVGNLNNGENLSLEFKIIQNANFDTTQDPLLNPETVANSLDPSYPAEAPNQVTLSYQNGCSNAGSDLNSENLNASTPDVDVSVSPASQVVKAGDTYTFTYTLTNAGEVGSVASAIEFTPTIAAGWTGVVTTVTTAGTGGTGGVCAGTCTAAQIGKLGQGQNAVIEITGLANNNGSPLEISGLVVNRNLDDAGADTGNLLSQDSARPKLIGYFQNKTLVSTNESFTTDPNVAVGEEVTWNLSAGWFGLSGAETVTNIVMRDTLPVGLGYVSHADQAGNTLAYTFSGPSPVSTGTLNYSLASLASPGGVLDVHMVSRVRNIGLVQASLITNNFGVSFDYLGQNFASDNAADGFGGAESDLHKDVDVTLGLPEPTFVKTVRNLTKGTAFGASTAGEAGDELEYRILINNTGDAPLFDLVVNDTMSFKLNLIDGASDGINNDGNGAPEGGFTPGLGGSLVFNHANTLLTSGSSLERLDPGNTITLLYRATLSSSANPSETLTNSASLNASSLPGLNSNQTAPLGAAGTPEGEQTFNLTDSADVLVDQVDFTKLVNNTSVGSDTNLNVVVGEQVEFALDIILPASTIPSFNVNDDIPAGMRLVAAPLVDVHSTTCSLPTVTPAAPVSGAVGLNLNFGNCSVPSGLTDAQRTVSIKYTLQVENIAANVEAATLVNRARYSFTGFSSPDSVVTMTVREPILSVVAKTASPTSGLNAGDEVTYTVELTNSGVVPAYDLNLVDTLDAKTEYVASSTSSVTGPAMTEPSLSANVLTWGRTRSPGVSLDLGGGQSLEFTYKVKLLNSVEPSETLSNSIVLDYTSLSGDPGPNIGVSLGAAGTAFGERIGTGSGVNDYRHTSQADVVVQNAFSVLKTSSGDSLSPNGFRVGDLVTYSVEINLQEGSVDALSVQDTLPSGLEFFDRLSLLPASSVGAGSINYTNPADPATGATNLNWNFGSLIVDGDNLATNDKLTLTYRAIVVDSGGVSSSLANQSLDNSAQVVYELESGASANTATSVASINVKQPILTTTKTLTGAQPSEVEAGDAVNFTVTIANSGEAPSYNTVVVDTLPVEMRDTAPSVVSASLNGAAISLSAPVWNPVTGQATWSLTDAQDIQAGQSLVINYQATVDSDVGAGQSFSNSALVQTSASLPSSSTSAERRVYGVGTADQASLSTASPNDMGKTVDVSEANIAEEVTYTLRVPNTVVPSLLYDVNVSDALPAGLEIVSVSTNAASLGVTVSDTSTGTNVNLEFERIPKDQQAIVEVVAKLTNVVGNQSGTSLSNTASYTWAGTSGGTAQPAISSPTRSVDVTEPSLSFTKTFKSQSVSDPSLGLQAGDSVTYTIRVENTGDGDAHDLRLTDLADENLISPVVIANPDNPGAPSNLGTVAGVTRWEWNLTGSLIAKTTGVYQFDVRFTLGSSVKPYMNLENSGGVDYTSAAGVVAGERDGSGGVNDYIFNQASPVVVQTGNIKVNKNFKAPVVTEYGVGGEVTYELVADFGQGDVDKFHFVDSLPVGMEYVSASVSANNMQQQGGAVIGLLSAPSAGDVGSLSFNLGDIESTGANPSISLEVVARVLNLPANVDGHNLINTALAQLEDPDDASTVSVNSATSASLEVIEPNLLLNLDGPANVDLDAEADFTARVFNSGRQAAFQPKVEIEIPANLRGADPSAASLAVEIAGGRSLVLASGVDFTSSYDAGSGRFIISLISAQAFIAQNENLSVGFKVSADSGATTTTGASYQMRATVSEFSSQDRSAGAVTQNRIDSTAFGTGSLGTANGVNGDDQTDDHNFDIRAPQLVITKEVDVLNVVPGGTLTYTVSIVNTGAIDAQITEISDDLSEHFLAGSLTAPTVVGATPSSITSDASGGANATGTWSVLGLVVPNTGVPVVIEFTVQTKRPLASGTQIFNQTSADVLGYDDSFVSDSANASDNDGVETGNDSGDADDDDPTLSTVTSEPAVTLLKNSVISSPPLSADGEITYTLTASNSGDENLVNAVIQDSIPAHTTYVPNSTFKDPNGSPVLVPDVGGTSALVAGLAIDGPSANTLEVDQSVEYSFRVKLDPGVTNGTIITNQAVVNGAGDGSGVRPPTLSDDPDTAFGPDPTQDVVGTAPALYAIKTVTDVNGGLLVDGESLRYSIVIRNNGSTPLTNLNFSDELPANTSYTTGSLTYDEDHLGPAVSVALTDAVDADDGDFNSGSVHVSIDSLAASSEVQIEFLVTVNVATPAGTVISNQGLVTGDGVPNTLTDFDANSSNGAQATDIVVGNQGVLKVTKEVSDPNGGTVEPGDDLLYTIRIRNIGTQTATGVVVTDPMPTPASVAYVLGTTQVNSAVVGDVAGDSALVSGLSLSDLSAGAETVITYKVNVPIAAPVGTLIRNQASYTSADAGSGVSDSDRDDDIENGNDATDPNDDDPTEVQIGGAPGVASVGGSIWKDIDHNKIIDGGESLEQGWTVEVLLGNLVVGTGVSDANGEWSINGLTPGSGYQIRFRHPVSGNIFGGAASSEPGVDTSTGSIRNLRLPSGLTIVNQNLPLDPSGVVYDSVSRGTVANARVAITGPVGFDPVVHTLQGMGELTTASDGFYRYDLQAAAPAGTYNLVVTVPAGYLPNVSSLIPPTASLCDPLAPACNPGALDPFTVSLSHQAPVANGGDETYYLSFVLDASNPATPDVINNHIPIDPILKGAIRVTKTATKKNVTTGAFSNYNIRVENTLNVPLGNLDVEDILPPGFIYAPGSATVSGASLEPTQNGRVLTWKDQSFAAKEVRDYKITSVVGAAVRNGTYCNQAQVRQNIVNQVITDVSKACVRVVPDPTFDCPDLIGKVFDDKNKNGYQDKGEEGLSGVKLITTKGWVVQADEQGRYHIACPIQPNPDRGSNFAVKVDSSSLPTGYRMTTENPIVVRLSQGKLSKANFGASIHRVIGIDLKDEAFVKGSLDKEWVSQIPKIAQLVAASDSVIRITYDSKQASLKEIKERIKDLKKLILDECKKQKIKRKILFEDFIYKGGSH